MPGIAAIIDAVKPATLHAPLQSEMDTTSLKLREQQYSLMAAEVDFDLKSYRVWLRRVQDYELRLLSQKDEWLMKRHQAAKVAMDVYLESKVGLRAKLLVVN